MNRNLSTGLAITATLVVSLILVDRGNALRKGISSTHRVVIDGRSFVSDQSPSDDVSLLKRELGKTGIRLPDEFDLPEGSGPSHPAFSDRLKESPSQVPIEPPRLPAGLNAVHTLRMEREGMPVDLVIGTLGTPGPSIRSSMLSSGWKSASTVKISGGTHVLQINNEKEAAIVFLDEADRTFLLLREVGR